MRWNYHAAKDGDERIIRKFLLFPYTLPNKSKNYKLETRWLEISKIQQYYSTSWRRWFDECWED